MTQPGGNYFNKYESQNPLYQMLVKGFLMTLTRLLAQTESKEVYECGCGEGFLSLHMMKKGYYVKGCDIDASTVKEANAKASALYHAEPFEVKDIYELEGTEGIADTVVCCEVLEHVEDPEKALEILKGLTRRWLVLSVPREPVWRILNCFRFRYLAQLGNTPGHLNHWSTASFVQFAAKAGSIENIATPLPWTFVLIDTKKE